MTQISEAKAGNITPEMEYVARKEGVEAEHILQKVATGRVVIPKNRFRSVSQPCGIGEGLRVKVNANIGTSSDVSDPQVELKKLNVAVEAGADTVMDLSTGGDLRQIRKLLLGNSPIPFGTVPIYEAVVKAVEEKGALINLDPEDIFQAIEEQAEDGVDFMTVHCGLTLEGLELLRTQKRITDIVSRGGAFIATWMIYHGKENPLYTNFDRILNIAQRYDITLSLGDGLRPGCIEDATDRAQIHELMTLGHLAKMAREKGVQVMIEGPGHVPIDQIQLNIRLQKSLCDNAPFYVLGPLVIDVAAGYDHVACAIGGAIAAYYGADFLCYVTPAEHLCLPSVEDVREGVIVSKIAAHAADIARKNPLALKRDREMAMARKSLDWERQIELAIDPKKARDYRSSSEPHEKEVCTMCGKFCAIKQVREFLGTTKGRCS